MDKNLMFSKRLFNIEQKEVVIMFLFMLLSLSARFLLNQLSSLDEIFNYQFARRILYGQIPYKDFYMIPAPFAMQINALFLKLFSDNLVVMRIVGTLVASVNGVIIYLITLRLDKNHFTALLTVCFFTILVYLYPQNNYSWFAVLFLSIALILELRKLRYQEIILEAYLFEFIIGVSLGLTTISKQNIGLIGLVASSAFLFYYFIFISKEEKPLLTFTYNMVVKFVGWALVVGGELLFLWHNTALLPFIDQAFINTVSFASKVSIPYTSLLFDSLLLFRLLAAIIPLGIIVLFVKGILSKEPPLKKGSMVLVSLYAGANFAMIYPLADTAHLIMGMPLAIVAFTLINDKKPKPLSIEKKTNIRPAFIILLASIFFVGGILQKPADATLSHNIRHYKYIPLDERSSNRLSVVGSYITNAEKQGYEVFFLHFTAPYFLIPLGKFGYKSDTMFKGNFGSYGKQDIIDKLNSSDNPMAIIRGQDIPVNPQDVQLFESYVKDSMTYLTTVNNYDVYINHP